MQGPFRGIAKTLSGIFGGPVTIQPESGGPYEVRGIFRQVAGVVVAEGGAEVVVTRPQIKLHRPDADQIFEGDDILPGDGKTYRACGRTDPASPAPDALVTLDLEEV